MDDSKGDSSELVGILGVSPRAHVETDAYAFKLDNVKRIFPEFAVLG
jgi:hypothetical protein